MAVGVLIDTNIFIEVALAQQRSRLCQAFLEDHAGRLCISNFGLHSTGGHFASNEEDATLRNNFLKMCMKVSMFLPCHSSPSMKY